MAIAGGRVLLRANHQCLGKTEPPGKCHVLGRDGALEGVSWGGGVDEAHSQRAGRGSRSCGARAEQDVKMRHGDEAGVAQAVTLGRAGAAHGTVGEAPALAILCGGPGKKANKE